MLKENWVTLRNNQLFNIIYTNLKIQIFQNETFFLALYRAGAFPWNQSTNWPKLPVSKAIYECIFDCSSNGWRFLKSMFIAIMIWMLFVMKVASRKPSNVLCPVTPPILLAFLSVLELKIRVCQVRIFKLLIPNDNL